MVAVLRKFLVVSLLITPATSAWAARVRYENNMWVLRTSHYLVRSDVSAEFTLTLGRHMEAIHKEYKKRLKGFGGRVKHRFEVTVSLKEERYLYETGIRVRGSKGIFVPSKRLLAAWAGDTPHDRVFRVLYHEGFHQFVHHYIGKCPIWLNEGMAEFFSEATWNGKRFDVGEVPPHRLSILRKAIKEDRTIRMRDLLTMSHGEWVASISRDRWKATVQYNQSWGLVHFLVHGDNGRYRDAFVRYIKLIDRDTDPEKAFRRCFGRNFDGLKTSWEKYIESLQPSDKHVCRTNLRALAALWKGTGPLTGRPKTIHDLRKQLLEQPGRTWSFTGGDGTEYPSNDREGAARVFVCPLDKRKDAECSYVLHWNPGQELPDFICDHHPAIRIAARFVRDREGEPEIQVTETIASPRRERLIPPPAGTPEGQR